MNENFGEVLKKLKVLFDTPSGAKQIERNVVKTIHQRTLKHRSGIENKEFEFKTVFADHRECSL